MHQSTEPRETSEAAEMAQHDRTITCKEAHCWGGVWGIEHWSRTAPCPLSLRRPWEQMLLLTAQTGSWNKETAWESADGIMRGWGQQNTGCWYCFLSGALSMLGECLPLSSVPSLTTWNKFWEKQTQAQRINSREDATMTGRQYGVL